MFVYTVKYMSCVLSQVVQIQVLPVCLKIDQFFIYKYPTSTLNPEPVVLEGGSCKICIIPVKKEMSKTCPRSSKISVHTHNMCLTMHFQVFMYHGVLLESPVMNIFLMYRLFIIITTCYLLL